MGNTGTQAHRISGMKATALAPANIAFIKYWGKADAVLRLPMNTSISMNLSAARTVTTVEFSNDDKEDRITMMGETMSTKEQRRIRDHLDRIRENAGTHLCAHVVTKNTFPKGTGIASSASGFAALTVAACAAMRLQYAEKDLSILARLGSGSACRSIPDGFVQWEKGFSSETSYAHSLYPASHWDLRDIVCIVKQDAKKTSSTQGMDKAQTSPRWRARLVAIGERVKRTKEALEKKDIRLLGEVIEEEALNMHAVMQTQKPPLYYWSRTTEKIMEAVVAMRKSGISVYYTIDAGPNVHLICESRFEKSVLGTVKFVKNIKKTMVNKPSQGTHIIDEHLF